VVNDALCDIDAHYAKLLFHDTRSYGFMVIITSLTILAHQSRSAQGRVHYIRVSCEQVQDVDPFSLHPIGLVGAIMVADLTAIIVIDSPQRDRRAHDMLGEIPR
jgi:hypothetical protein